MDVHTTAATATDVKQLMPIQRRLAARGMLPAEQLADSSYVCGSNLVSSHACQIDLIGPAFKDNTWQAKASEGFDVANFRIDWNNKILLVYSPSALEKGTKPDRCGLETARREHSEASIRINQQYRLRT